MVFKRCVELCDKISESSKGKCGAGDGTLSEGGGPGEGGPLHHVREGKGDLFFVGIVDGFVDKEVEPHGM